VNNLFFFLLRTAKQFKKERYVHESTKTATDTGAGTCGQIELSSLQTQKIKTVQ
jgi:hypothetical protein